MRFKLLRPTERTPFHIDWGWFDRNQINSESIVRTQLTGAARARLESAPVETVDFIDPESGEVFQMDNLREAILAECQWEPEYLARDLPLAQAILRLFLAQNNEPMTPTEIAQRLGRHDPQAILRMLTGSGVTNGVVPVRD